MCEGIFEARWSQTFADVMKAAATDLMQHFAAYWCYTQSDEIVLVVLSKWSASNPNYQHLRGGKVQKLVSLAAARASASATSALLAMRLRQYPDRMEAILQSPILIEFDCRMATWDSPSDAFQLVLWRAYDCGVNGVSDACHNQVGGRAVIHLGTRKKLRWLHQNGNLPLPLHQAYGTLYVRTHRPHVGRNPKTGEEVHLMRLRTEPLLSGNVIRMLMRGEIPFPPETVEPVASAPMPPCAAASAQPLDFGGPMPKHLIDLFMSKDAEDVYP